jgi:hypothetical protein
MAEDATPPVQSVIDTFERRARGQQWAARGFLGLMAAGIVTAILVFIYAKAITERETTTTDIPTRMSSLNKLIDENRLMTKEKISSLNLAEQNLLKELPTQAKENCKSIKIGSLSRDEEDIFFTENGQLKSKFDIVKIFCLF